MSEKTIHVKARAKLNLRLKILSREESGYHSIETIFHKIDLSDDITLQITGGAKSLKISGPELPAGGLGPDENNLAYRAATEFQKAAQWPNGFAIEIVKNIPTGGGLGGGSADAAAVLKALNSAAPTPLAESDLLKIALQLGSDVPFLTSDAPMALAWGRGERMLSLPPLPQREVALILPGVPVPTAQAYQWVAESRKKSPESPTPEILLQQDLNNWETISTLYTNDFWPPVKDQFPQIRSAMEHIEQAAKPLSSPPLVGMTGSGSTLFVIGQDLQPVLKSYSGPGKLLFTKTSI